MAIIFDEVTAEVQTPPNAPAAPAPVAGPPAALDTEALLRVLERQAERQVRLKAD